MAEGEIQFQAQWMMDAGNVPVAANQLLLQLGVPTASTGKADGVYVAFGHLNPPIIDPNNPPSAEAMSNTVLPVVQVARVFVSRERLATFRDAITDFLDKTEDQLA